MRKGNLEFRVASYLLAEDNLPENPSWHINLYTPNYYYQKEADFDNKGDWYYYKGLSNCRVHKDCFKSPEVSMAIASFDYDKSEGFYELHFVGDRPLSLSKEEREIFWELIEYGNNKLNNET